MTTQRTRKTNRPTETLAQYWTRRELGPDLASEYAMRFLAEEYKVIFDYGTNRLERAETSADESAAMRIVERKESDQPYGADDNVILEQYVSNLMEDINAQLGRKIFCWEPQDSIKAIAAYFAERETATGTSAGEDLDIDAFFRFTPEETAAAAAKDQALAERRAALPKIEILTFAVTVEEIPAGWDAIDTTPGEDLRPAPTIADIAAQVTLSAARLGQLEAPMFVQTTPLADVADQPRMEHADQFLRAAYESAQLAQRAADLIHSLWSAFPASHYQRAKAAQSDAYDAARYAYYAAVNAYIGYYDFEYHAGEASAYASHAILQARETLRIQREHSATISAATFALDMFLEERL